MDIFNVTHALLQVDHNIRSRDTLPSFLDPEKGNTVVGEMKCYGLPYGGLGFASHIITYYTIICLWNRKRPFMPWKTKTPSWWKFNIFLGAAELTITVALAIFTIIRCLNRWEFMLIAIWQIFVSATLGFSAISAAWWTRNQPERPLDTVPLVNYNVLPSSDIDMRLPPQSYYPAPFFDPPSAAISRYGPYSDANTSRASVTPNRPVNWIRNAKWIWLYLPGLLTGLVGLFALVKQNWNVPKVALITYIMFGIPEGIIILAVLLGVYIISRKEGHKSWLDATLGGLLGVIGYGTIALAVVGLLYSDWVLGAIAGNLAGFPSSDNAWLFWGYFVAKRLPLAST
jgi:hypothetical protein